jgi:hypothetical protein
MFEQELKKKIELEVKGIDKNAHGWSFRPYMLKVPELVEFKYPNEIICKVWVVLREAEDGYSIIYDPEENEFCLATGKTIVSSYATFMETINAM